MKYHRKPAGVARSHGRAKMPCAVCSAPVRSDGLDKLDRCESCVTQLELDLKMPQASAP